MIAKLRRVRLYLGLSHDQVLRYYQGTAKHVVTTDLSGQTVQFPVKIIQPFVGHDGVHGFFDIFFDQRGKFVAIERSALNQ